ncbi:formyltetrahydrofolate deformylase [Mucilaginibacter rubeus]|uniref:Formyltetrahydrofolate deformylase n=1 Tax=Mucilaginibacter rubeus TaxID=2027860 RepID=A0AAE6MGN5_9SPHI|nr:MULTISPECIES: formyltetrahydrofolate deformylase [Mucilaginibacter]QEM02362.1 formyltetrahydrofolate deformylase [Mucilaginibacter rubeus]QEM14987.1 formyltetrahydrofolate deformylase [Mucilaginibacter gossypii]QTE42296.1 formyltetrahydrofolate deformylase [Mucilaginibacter rubeus]QTE48897.1 formyltetrahydrofolate deformylase [Mucilaginibacter rubeus]QTE53995.1 formyltetrahydrofolate deformylase [Mucilaginibacter rubeus]
MIIVIQCKDKVGLVAAISATLAKHLLNIVSMREHVDHNENVFFTRLEVEQGDDAGLEDSLRKILPEGAYISVNPEPVKKVIVLATKEYHCLSDILVRNHFNTLGASVQCVIGNHAKLQNICERFDIPFYHISHEQVSKAEFEQQVIGAIKQYTPDYVVLAKFMRILSPRFVAEFPMKIINIHHSFLPAFIGANPYKQAFERGVKLIGATAHYVSNELDEGPIIAQQIVPVNHSYSWTDMVKAGQEVETAVLAKALKLVFEDRVFVYKNKTVVFE